MSWSNAEERKDIAGWLGDAVYLGGGLGGSVSFGQDDWIADLDSDNLAHRMQSNSQCDLVDVMNDYYSQVSKEKDSDEVRAQEFLRNNPYKEVENDVLDRLNWGSERYSQLRRLNLDDLHRGSAAYKDTVNFLDRLKRYDNAK